jgi:hypothetical protein
MPGGLIVAAMSTALNPAPVMIPTVHGDVRLGGAGGLLLVVVRVQRGRELDPS